MREVALELESRSENFWQRWRARLIASSVRGGQVQVQDRGRDVAVVRNEEHTADVQILERLSVRAVLVLPP